MADNRIGIWSACGVGVAGVVYLIALMVGFATVGFSSPIVDPLLAVMEVLTVISAVLLLVMMSAVHSYASLERKTYSLLAVAFMTLAVGLTCTVHFVELTALRQMGTAGLVWPSVPYAVELLAWNFLLGLSLLFAARVFERSIRALRVRRALLLSGVLCVLGSIGPVAGNMRLQFIGVFGYAAVLPVACFLLARLLRSETAHHAEALP